jgi:hypothetical protein
MCSKSQQDLADAQRTIQRSAKTVRTPPTLPTSPERWVASAVLEKLKIRARNEGKVVRRMPALP